jgi:hypothetical protein
MVIITTGGTTTATALGITIEVHPYGIVTFSTGSGCYTAPVPAYLPPQPAPLLSPAPLPDPLAQLQEHTNKEEEAWRSIRGLLSAQERRLLSRYGYLPIKSKLHPGFTYRIPNDGGMPDIYYRGERVGGLCFGPLIDDPPLPAADHLLLHALWIEGDEAGYLEEARTWRENWYWPSCAWLGRRGRV